MNKTNTLTDDREILIRTIDLLTMELLRLRSENETLLIRIQTQQLNTPIRTYQPENVLNKAINYYRREGVRNTLNKILSKLRRK